MFHDIHGRWSVVIIGATLALLPVLGVEASASTDPDPSKCEVVHPYMPGEPIGVPAVTSDGAAGVGDVLRGGDAAYVASLGTAAAEWFVWYRDGEVVSDVKYDAYMGADHPGSTYTVTADDIGHTLTYVVGIKWGSGCNVVSAPAAAPPVAVKSETKVKVQVSPRTTKVPRVRVRVVQQRVKPEGFLTVGWKGTRRGSVAVPLHKVDRGRASVTLSALPPGQYRVTATFTDTSGDAFDGVSGRRTLRVR